jgi:hypothetical protein
VLAKRLAKEVTTLSPSNFQIIGVSGTVEEVQEAGELRLTVGRLGQSYSDMLVIDLDGRAANTGAGIGGLLGHSFLEHTVLTINDRNAMVKIERGAPVRRQP